MSEALPEKIPNPEKEERAISIESATADLEIDHANKQVKIQTISSKERLKGHSSKLLNELKTQFSDYEISGNAVPIDIVGRRDTMTDEETEKVFNDLFEFYKKNNFDIDEGGYFTSKPPHKLR